MSSRHRHPPARINDRQRRLPERLADLRAWVEMELALPEEDQVSMARMDTMARAFLGEFTQRALRRTERDDVLRSLHPQEAGPS